MTHNNPTEAPPPAGSDKAQQDVAKTSDTKAEATSTAKASDELSEDDLEAVAGGKGTPTLSPYNPPLR
jgi:hypothetical protein